MDATTENWDVFLAAWPPERVASMTLAEYPNRQIEVATINLNRKLSTSQTQLIHDLRTILAADTVERALANA